MSRKRKQKSPSGYSRCKLNSKIIVEKSDLKFVAEDKLFLDKSEIDK